MPKGKKLDLTTGVKCCPRCEETKPFAEFYKDRNAVSGVQPYCKLCSHKRQDEWRRNNLEYAAGQSRKWRKENPEKTREHNRRSHYGLPFGTYDKMLSKQGGKCAICASPDAGGRGAFHVDHCHDTGAIRGLLCHGCNVGIGYLKHDVTLLSSAIQYLTGK